MRSAQDLQELACRKQARGAGYGTCKSEAVHGAWLKSVDPARQQTRQQTVKHAKLESTCTGMGRALTCMGMPLIPGITLSPGAPGSQQQAPVMPSSHAHHVGAKGAATAHGSSWAGAPRLAVDHALVPPQGVGGCRAERVAGGQSVRHAVPAGPQQVEVVAPQVRVTLHIMRDKLSCSAAQLSRLHRLRILLRLQSCDTRPGPLTHVFVADPIGFVPGGMVTAAQVLSVGQLHSRPYTLHLYAKM